MELVKYEGSDEWSALYVDGKLDTVGDHYHATERIEQLVGVKVIQNDDFLRGGNYRADVAPTLEDLNLYVRERERREAEAARLRAQAAELRAQADALVGA